MAHEISENSLLTGSEIYTGTDAIAKNLEAIGQIYNNLKTSYGPLGLDKMCVDASGDIIITNDGATILKNMLVEDPTAKLLVNLALEQDKEVGDGTTSVVLLAYNLIQKGAQLIREGVHPSTVVAGYRMAFLECTKYIKTRIMRRVKSISTDPEIVDAIIRTSMSSKIIGDHSSHFTGIIKNALFNVAKNDKYEVESIKIVKHVGGSLRDTEFVLGHIINSGPVSKLMAREIKGPRVLCADVSLLRKKLPLTVNICVSDPEKIEEIRQKEVEMTKNECQAIIDAGANVVFCTGGIDEICIDMFVRNGVLAVRRIDLSELRNLAAALGTDVKKSLIDIGEENSLGSCGSVEVRDIGGYEVVCCSGCNFNASTLVVRGPNVQIVEEVTCAMNDALQVLKRTLESRAIVPGGGAVEAALMFVLDEFSRETNCNEHVAIYKYAESLLEIPKILASNAGLNVNVLIGDLLKRQHESFKQGEYENFYGLDVVSETIQENVSRGIIEPAVYKMKMLKAATEAAISVLRINEIVVFPGSGGSGK